MNPNNKSTYEEDEIELATQPAFSLILLWKWTTTTLHQTINKTRGTP